MFYNFLYYSYTGLNKSSLYKYYKLDLLKLEKNNNNFFQSVKITDYLLFSLNEEIRFSYYCKFIKSKDKIKILYLIF